MAEKRMERKGREVSGRGKLTGVRPYSLYMSSLAMIRGQRGLKKES